VSSRLLGKPGLGEWAGRWAACRHRIGPESGVAFPAAFCYTRAMKTNRRHFLHTAGLAAGAFAVLDRLAPTALAGRGPSFLLKAPTMKLGLVTYNLAEKWDVRAIIKNCEAGGFEGVELRTTHAHKVEVDLTKEQRAEVKKLFQDSKVQLMGLGSIFDYHTPDQARLRKDIEATKQYILLAQDVGAGGVKVRPNGLPKEVPVEKTLEQIGKSLRELGDFARDHGQVIRLEVHGSGTAQVPYVKKIMDVADHKSVGACWNSNQSDLDGEGFDKNFDLLKDKIFEVHMRDIYLEEYPWRKLLTRLNEIPFTGFCLAEIGPSTDPIRVMKYYRALWLAYQGLM
jgi:sugar phosphate isomerase/epimerase